MSDCTTNQNVAVLEIDNDKILPYYLAEYFNSLLGQIMLNRVSTQATIKYINNEILARVKVPVINFSNQLEVNTMIRRASEKEIDMKRFIREAKQDVEDLIEGKFDESKISG
jgi:restriction endonuclease S subunit